MPSPDENCPKCKQTYLACPACGRTSHQNDTRLKNEGDTCVCGRGTLATKTTLICCRRHNHHIGSTCPHCGAKD